MFHLSSRFATRWELYYGSDGFLLVFALGFCKYNQEVLLYGDCVGYLLGVVLGVILGISVGKPDDDKECC